MPGSHSPLCPFKPALQVRCGEGAAVGGQAARTKDLQSLPALPDGQLKLCRPGGERVVRRQDGWDKSVTSTWTAMPGCFPGPLSRILRHGRFQKRLCGRSMCSEPPRVGTWSPCAFLLMPFTLEDLGGKFPVSPLQCVYPLHLANVKATLQGMCSRMAHTCMWVQM